MHDAAMILFAHGARNPAWAQPFERLQQMLQRQMPGVPVRLAFLELMQPSLEVVVQTLLEQGRHDIRIVPVFLGQGGHVQRDLPLKLTQLRQQYPSLQLQLSNSVGEDETVLAAIAGFCLQQMDDLIS
jgi:sirohydrochlorin cobaltochelatase